MSQQPVTTTRILDVQVKYDKAIADMARYKKEIEELTLKQNEFRKAAKDGAMGDKEAREACEKASVAIRERKDIINTLSRQVQNQIRTEREEEGSLKQLRAEISNLNKQYDEMSRAEREGAKGDALLKHINQLTTELKQAEEASQRYYRNVGNYGMAMQNGVVTTTELNRALGVQAHSIEACIEQNRELEKVKMRLNTSDANYAKTVDAINKKIEENKRKITDVDSVMKKQATSVSEAQSQNKLLVEALKNVDLSADGAQAKIKQLNAKIDENNKLIEKNAPALMTQSQASQGLADSVLNLCGVNGRFGSSIVNMGQSATAGGSILDGLGTKVTAFGKSLLGLLANPMVLAFIGLAGGAAGVKWWFDFNEGLVEATKLTEEFTGMSGDKMKAYRSEVMAVADTYGKDFKEVLQTADALAANFGISFEEALQTVKDGFVSGADVNGDMLAKLQKYPASFHEAGVSAQEFTALVSQTKSGIFGDKGLDAIKVATERIRRMPSATKEALESIGMSADAVQKGLEDGSLQTIDVVQQISARLKDLPDSSQEVGDVLFNVFGKKGPDAGLEMIRSLSDIDTNLESVKASTGELGSLQEQQMESQIELEQTLSAVFDATGGSFESLTTSARVFINKGISDMIKWTVKLINWFIELYNESALVRGIVLGIGAAFKTIWSVISNVCGMIYNIIAGLGTMIKGAFTLDWDEFSAGWTRATNALAQSLSSIVNDAVDNAKDAWSDLDNRLEPIELKLNVTTEETMPSSSAGHGVGDNTATDIITNPDGTPTGPAKDSGKSSESAAKKEAERQEKERLRREKVELDAVNRLQEELYKIMKDGAEKRRIAVETAYDKEINDLRTKIATEMGLSEEARDALERMIVLKEEEKQEALRKLAIEEMKRAYDDQTKINEMRLEAVAKGSEEELSLRMENLRMKQEMEDVAAREAYDAEKESLERLKALREAFAKDSTDAEAIDLDRRIAEQAATVERGQQSISELQLKHARERERVREENRASAMAAQRQEIETMIAEIEIGEQQRLMSLDKFGQQREETERERIERQLAAIGGAESERLRLLEEAAMAEYDAIVSRGALSTQTQAEYDAELVEAKRRWVESQKAIDDAYVKNEQAKLAAVKTVTSGLSSLLDQLGQDNKAFAKMSKVVALAQVAIDTGVAISEGLKASAGVPFPGNIAAIATTVGTVLANIATAISTIKAAKFAKGGKVTGPGSGTSDDIPAMLSNGEFVMTARATRMFEPLLVAMNNISPSMPNMQLKAAYDTAAGRESVADSLRQAVTDMPNPVVSVEEINRVSKRVDVIEHLDNI